MTTVGSVDLMVRMNFVLFVSYALCLCLCLCQNCPHEIFIIFPANCAARRMRREPFSCSANIICSMFNKSSKNTQSTIIILNGRFFEWDMLWAFSSTLIYSKKKLMDIKRHIFILTEPFLKLSNEFNSVGTSNTSDEISELDFILFWKYIVNKWSFEHFRLLKSLDFDFHLFFSVCTLKCSFTSVHKTKIRHQTLQRTLDLQFNLDFINGTKIGFDLFPKSHFD